MEHTDDVKNHAGAPSALNVGLGARVNTPLGCGEVVGKEEFFKDYRWLVRLDDPSRWSFGKETDIAAFFRNEVVHNACRNRRRTK